MGEWLELVGLLLVISVLWGEMVRTAGVYLLLLDLAGGQGFYDDQGWLGCGRD